MFLVVFTADWACVWLQERLSRQIQGRRSRPVCHTHLRKWKARRGVILFGLSTHSVPGTLSARKRIRRCKPKLQLRAGGSAKKGTWSIDGIAYSADARNHRSAQPAGQHFAVIATVRELRDLSRRSTSGLEYVYMRSLLST